MPRGRISRQLIGFTIDELVDLGGDAERPERISVGRPDNGHVAGLDEAVEAGYLVEEVGPAIIIATALLFDLDGLFAEGLGGSHSICSAGSGML